jgi:hypothetical protein
MGATFPWLALRPLKAPPLRAQQQILVTCEGDGSGLRSRVYCGVVQVAMMRGKLWGVAVINVFHAANNSGFPAKPTQFFVDTLSQNCSNSDHTKCLQISCSSQNFLGSSCGYPRTSSLRGSIEGFGRVWFPECNLRVGKGVAGLFCYVLLRFEVC